jgi:hypothetical protein
MDWKARIEIVQEVNQGNMQVGATLADMDVPEPERVEYPWTYIYTKEWLQERTNQQVRQEVIQDMTNSATSLASSAVRIDYFKQFVGQVIDLDVVIP